MGYTYEQLKQMGAVPGASSGSASGAQNSAVPKKGYTYEELLKAGATPSQKTQIDNNPSFDYNPDDSKIKSNLKTLGNIPGSAWEVGKGLGTAVLHPVQTAKGIGSVAAGGVQKLIPGEQEQEKSFDSVVDFFKQRYGSYEAMKKTGIEDPVGFALDLSILFSGGGSTATKVGSLSKINRATKASNIAARAGKTGAALKKAKQVSNIGQANVLTDVGGALSKTGSAINPITQGTRLFGKGIKVATQGKKIGGKKYTTENLAATSNIGVASEDLPIFAKTTSPISTTAEAVASKGIGGGPIWDRMNNLYVKMNDTVDNLLKGKVDASVIGRSMANAADDFKNKFYEQKNKLYEQAIIPRSKTVKNIPGFEKIKTITLGKEDKMFASWNKKVLANGKIKYTKPSGKELFSGKQTPMPASTTATQKLLRSLIENEKQALKGYGVKSSPELKTYEGLMRGLSGKSMTTGDVYRTLQKIEGDLKYGTTIKTGNNAKLALIRDTLDAEFLATLKLQRPDLAIALDKADKFFRQGVRKLNSGVIQAIVKNVDKPDLIVKTLLPRLKSLDDVKILVEVLGQKNMAELRKSIMSAIFTEARGPAKENLPPLGISKQLKKFGEDKLEILLNPDQFQAVKDLEQVSKMMGKSSKITGGSQTSFNVLSTVGGGSAFTAVTLLLMGNAKGAILALTPLMGTIAAAKFINSNLGRQLLTEGIELSGKTGAKIQSAAPAIGTGAQVSNQLNNLYNSQ